MNAALIALAMGFLAPAESQNDEPIALHPANSHYFQFRGRPTVLVTSGEHYGAVLNLDFDFIPYLDTLARHGFNQTRTFAGTYREVPGSFQIENNTLAPTPNRYLAPWKKVADASGANPERFDLDAYDPAYFERLKHFITEAGKRGIVVELVLFCPFYEDILWDVNPMNARNNVNDVGNCPREEAYTTKHPQLLEKQLAFVRKLVAELNSFDNLYFEICNEPYFGGVTLEWQRKIAEAIVETEDDLPNQHLIAQNIANKKQKVDEPVHPAVSILNFHYAEPAAALENYALDRALGDDETGFAGNDDRPYRTEAWLFLLSGGSVYSNLDYSYTPIAEDGSARVKPPTPGGGGETLRNQLSFLKKFIEGFNFLAMAPATVARDAADPGSARMAVLAEPGRQYAVYLDGAGGNNSRTTIRFDLPSGRYAGTWFDPRTGQSLGDVEINHDGGAAAFSVPPHKEDAALRLLVKPNP